jgi:hypothetical protein
MLQYLTRWLPLSSGYLTTPAHLPAQNDGGGNGHYPQQQQ